MTHTEINETTGFANGDEFTSDAEVHEYFTVANMKFMFDGLWPDDVSQDRLDEMARTVIANRWHYTEDAA